MKNIVILILTLLLSTTCYAWELISNGTIDIWISDPTGFSNVQFSANPPVAPPGRQVREAWTYIEVFNRATGEYQWSMNQVREGFKSQAVSTANDLIGLYSQLDNLAMQIDDKRMDISQYISAPQNDKAHPALMDELKSLTIQYQDTEVQIDTTTTALLNTQGTGQPGWVTVPLGN